MKAIKQFESDVAIIQGNLADAFVAYLKLFFYFDSHTFFFLPLIRFHFEKLVPYTDYRAEFANLGLF